MFTNLKTKIKSIKLKPIHFFILSCVVGGLWGGFCAAYFKDYITSIVVLLAGMLYMWANVYLVKRVTSGE